MVTIYGVDGGAPSRAVYLVAKAIGIDIEKKTVNLRSKEHKSAAYMKINPQGLVPAIVDGDLKFGESRAIITYLMNKYAPTSSMYPSDPAARALVDDRLYFDAFLFAALRGLVVSIVVEKNPEKSNYFLPELHEKLKTLERFLGQSQFVAGSEATVADISILATVSSTQQLQIDLPALPKTEAWLAKMHEVLPFIDEIIAPVANDIIDVYIQSKKELEGK